MAPSRCRQRGVVAALGGLLACVALAGPQLQAPDHGAADGAMAGSLDGSGHGSAHDAARGEAGAGEGSAAPLQLSRAWVRAMPPGRAMTAAYLTVVNPTDAAITITSVRASRGDASLHENRRVDGQVQMRALPVLTLPARGEVSLAPGGLHIMLMGLDSTPTEGETLQLCLTTTAGIACTDAPVLRRAPDSTASAPAEAGHRH